MTANPAHLIGDECYRCGYDLRGIANDGPCPECGLLAERSRRLTDELHDTRPRWLRSLFWGINLILLAMVAPIAGPTLLILLGLFFPIVLTMYLPYFGFDLAALFLLLGVIFLTRREGYVPADRADRKLRLLLRIAAIIPTSAIILLQVQRQIAIITGGQFIRPDPLPIFWIVFLVIVSILPLLLFLHLRGLARRVRSAQLAEDCVIVGIGAFASTLYLAAVIFILNKADSWGLQEHWVLRSNVPMIMMLLVGVACALFTLWAFYLLVCFALAIWTAARTLRQKWRHDDRALTT